ncbi:hypothetical protein HA402_010958 [Bradysia odoriphaga]|nr:hypothetical protein HA402_010958 [Bradysia odoriphaga]
MGYDVERFVGGAIERELICQICASVLQDPWETPCEHFFCMTCMQSWLAVSETCPIDRQPIRTADLKQPSRLLRNLLAQLDIKCDFVDNGCSDTVKLENLASHRTTCTNNPDAVIQCDQGCNLQIKRSDQSSQCAQHFLDKINSQDAKISGLSKEVIDQRAANDVLKEQVEELNDFAYQLQQDIARLTGAPTSKVRFLINVNRAIVWKTIDNMKTNGSNGILENDDRTKRAVAQLAHCLEPSYPSFGLCVLNSGHSGPMIGIGLTEGSEIESGFLYLNDGRVFLDETIVHVGEAWEEGDHICCDIKFPVNGDKIRYISFFRNSKEVFTISSERIHAMLPTVWLGPA